MADVVPVSRETQARLDVLSALVRRWNPAINLIAPGTLPDLWQRHIADSLQLVPLAPRDVGHWADLGSGGGFPGLVVAAALADSNPTARVTLVESDRRKAVFLRQAAADMGVRAAVVADRAERIDPLGADVVSARALAPLDALLPLVRRHLRSGGLALLPKGARHEAELTAAQRRHAFTAEVVASRTDPSGVILRLSQFRDA